ncbi:MAG: Ig-like domain-containing protein [Bacteroidaceae bacterium]|nr:Ig-like domain-containing protein [Bacteroidaceae bacterium]MBR4793530.1 Ig-like domain-containing protein [Bacteroidaceae bacterium]
MKSIIRFAALLLMMVCAQTAKAQMYIMVHKTDGNTLRIAVSDVDSVTFREWTGPIFSYEYVDLGLSVQWATCNVGATSPEQTGGYYAWGETEEKEAYTQSNYKYLDSKNGYIKYNFWESQGKVDMKYRLDPDDDAATVLLGQGWRTPTREELQELMEYCNWSPAMMNGVQGYRVTSQRNNNSIFLPFTGERWNSDTIGYNKYAYYYSNTLAYDNPGTSTYVYTAYMYNYGEGSQEWYEAYYNRRGGLAIRPVYSSEIADNIFVAKEVSIEEDEVSIEVGESVTLNGYAITENGTYVSPEWKSSNSLIARVDGNKVFGQSEGECMIYASFGNVSDSCLVKVAGIEEIREYVNLGLSVNWATCNIGASRPERVGLYYAWGETEIKSVYNWSTYKYSNEDGLLTKYCSYAQLGVDGFVDNLKELEPADDAAHVLWGDDWRMPTYEEITELIENCDFDWVEYSDGGYVIIVTSRVPGYEKNSIILPYSEDMGGVCLWTSTAAGRSDNALLLYENTNRYMFARCNGLPIRPVCPNAEFVEPTLELSDEALTIVEGQTSQLMAVFNSMSVSEKAEWTTSDTTVAVVNGYGYITAIAQGTCTITATYKGQSASCVITVTERGQISYVDLGLSVKWATFNVGAADVADFGDYFAWGETEPYYTSITRNIDAGTMSAVWKEGKEYGYDVKSYKWLSWTADSISYYYTKYVTDSDYGTPDGKYNLDLADDAANANWGGNWRTPTASEFQELIRNCDLYWTNINGVQGIMATSLVSGFEKNSIFLPAAGDFFGTDGEDLNDWGAIYWTSSLYDGGQYVYGAVLSNGGSGFYRLSRWSGLAIRPVCGYDASDIESISLNKSTLSLALNSFEELYVSPLNSAGKEIVVDSLDVIWTSSNDSVAIVVDGKVKATGVGTCTITATLGNLTAECVVTVEDPSQAVPEYVDLGLSVKWATFNVGSFKPEVGGDLFAWGETEPYYEAGYATATDPVWKEGKTGYNWKSYRWAAEVDSMNKPTLTKYIIDGKYVLDPADDPATQLWGSEWRTPTVYEFAELAEKCSVELLYKDDVLGLNFTSRVAGYEGNSIFIPYVGYRSGIKFQNNIYPYWTSTAYEGEQEGYFAYYANFQSKGGYTFDYYTSLFLGMPIRPVQNFDDSEIDEISLNETKAELFVRKSTKLLAKGVLSGREISLNGTVNWTSSNDSVVTVVNGLVKAVGAGTATVVAEYNDFTAECAFVVIDPNLVEKEYVDLGLSVNWATFNVGAIAPEGIGDYYAWGETESKSSYNWSNYKYCAGLENSLTKYCQDEEQGYEGFTDSLAILEPDDDVAHVIWGGEWRMPTHKEYQELMDKCNWVWTEVNGINGFVVTSTVPGYEDNYIFLPAAGYAYGNYIEGVGDYGDYWTSYTESSESWEFYMYSNYREPGPWSRYVGLTVRPVCKNNNYVDRVILTDNVTVLVNEVVDGEMVYHAEPRIVADPADSANQCIMVTSNSYPENYYDSQIFISVDSAKMLPGAVIEFSFRYKADNYMDCSTEIHSTPGVWAGDFGGRAPYFTPEWQSYSIQTEIQDPNQRTFVINLSYLEEGSNFYFDDIKVTITDIMSTGFYLSNNYLNLQIGAYYNLYANDDDNNYLNSYVKWISTNDSVATVDEWGEVYAVGEGSCYIVASFRDYNDSCEVNVSKGYSGPDYGFRIDEDSTYCIFYYIDNGYGEGAEAKFGLVDSSYVSIAYLKYDFYSTEKEAISVYEKLTYGMTDDEIEESGITIDDTYIIRPLSEMIGVDRDTVIARMKEIYNSYFPEIPVDEPYLSIYPRKLDMYAGEIYSLSFETNTGETVVWTSSDDSVATVDKYGVVTAVAEGYCTIVAIAGDLRAECGVAVMPQYNDTVSAVYDFIISEDSLDARFYYIEEGEFDYEIRAEFGESDSGVVCTSIIYSITLPSAEEAQEAYESMTAELTDEFIESLNVVFNDEGTGFSYTNPEVIGMDREAVLAMMWQSYNSMVNPQGYEEEEEEFGYIGEPEPYLPAGFADSTAIAAWYVNVNEEEGRIKIQSVFLFEDGTLVATKSKFYTYKDGRNPEYGINGYGTYELTDGDFYNGAASVVLSDGTTFDVEIEEGVMSAMGEYFYIQDNDEAPSPM